MSLSKTGWTPLYCALYFRRSDTVVKIPGIDFKVKRKEGETPAQAAVEKGDVLANQEKFDCWNAPDRNGDTPVMMVLKSGKTDMVKILVGCPRMDLTIQIMKESNIWSTPSLRRRRP